MNREVLTENLSLTLHDMKVHTGKEPGGPTGFCHPVVIGALTGTPLDWGLGQRLTDKEREKLVGLECDRVITREALALDAVPALLEQKQLPIDAVLVTGQLGDTEGIEGRHIMGIIPTAGPIYRVVDSLLPGAVRHYIDTASVTSYLKGSFEPKNAFLRVLPSSKERARRQGQGTALGVDWLRIEREVYVEVPRMKS